MNMMNTSNLYQNDYREASIVVKAIHGDCPCTIVKLKRQGTSATGEGNGLYRSCGFNHGSYAEQVGLFPSYHHKGIEPFVMAGAANGEGTTDANVPHTWSFSVDFDHGYPDFLVGNSLIGPSLLIETSPYRFQAVWILDALCIASEAKPVLKAMVLRLGGDVAHAKVSQLIRLPGFLHAKRGTVAKLIDSESPTRVFSLEFLKAAFDVDFINHCIRAAMPRFDAKLEIPKKGANSHEVGQIVEDVESALPYLKEYAADYMDWLSTLMALVPLGDEGKRLAEVFSRYSTKFNCHEFESKWEAVQGNPGKVATIFLRAQNNGWKNPGYRNFTIDSKQVLTDRDLGRMIAAELGDSHAVTETYSGLQRNLNFLAWNGVAYTPMKEIDRRDVVEKTGKKVIDSLVARGGLKFEVIVRLKHKIGKNRTLNEVCDHVAEALVPESSRRILGNYPYFWVENGVVNLLSQELLPAQYRAVPMKGRSPVMFDPDARAPIFEKTVREVFEGDDAVIRYFYQIAGYMMLGKQKEQIFVIFYGPKAENGKNTIQEILSHILGTYATILTTTSIMTKSHVSDGATPSTAQLEGKRLAVVSEINSRHSLDSGAVKQMTGDRFMPVRRMYEDSKNIAIEFLLLMLTNELPKISEEDHGLWRRIRIIPFNRKFTKEEIDLDLPDKLSREASGIFNLMLAGARDYLSNGLITPEKVLVANGEQRKAVDPVAAVLDETMVIGGHDETPLKIIYDFYETWRVQNPGFPRLTKHQLQKKLEEKGFKKVVHGHLPSYHGLIPIEFPD